MADEQESLSAFSEKVQKQLASYIRVKIDLVKAEGAEKISLLFSKMLTGLIIVFILCFAILFASMVAGFYFGEQFGSLIMGFGVVALFYVLLLVLILVFRKKLIEYPVANAIISIIYQDNA